MSVRGRPGLTLFSIQPSTSLSGSASLSCCKKTINIPKICHTELLIWSNRRSILSRRKHVLVCCFTYKKNPNCASPLSSSIYSHLFHVPCGGRSSVKDIERTSIREPFAESSPGFPHATGRALFGDPFWAWLHHISRGVPYPTALPLSSSLPPNPETKPKLCLYRYNYNRSSTICNL